MKINFDSTITDLAGNPIQIDDKGVKRPCTLRDVCTNALLLETAKSQGIEGKEKVRRFRLADKIFGTKEPIQIEAEDIVLLKQLVAEAYAPLVTGRSWDLLET